MSVDVGNKRRNTRKKKILKWLDKAGRRAVRTMAQSAVAMIGTAAMMSTVDWKMVLSATALSGILSLLTSIAGLPELKTEKEGSDN